MPKKVNPPQPLEAVQISDALLALDTAGRACGMSVATLYRKARTDPTFPKLIRIGTRCTRIRAGDLTAWLIERANSSTDAGRTVAQAQHASVAAKAKRRASAQAGA